MYLSSVIVGSLVSSMLLSTSFYYSNVFIEKTEDSLENSNITMAKNASLEFYNKNGVLPSSASELQSYKSLEIEDTLLDKYGKDFQIIKKADNSPFSYDGSSDIYVMAIVAMNQNLILDSYLNLSTNTFEKKKGEKVFLVNKYELLKTYRGVTLESISKCSLSYGIYETMNSTIPNNMHDLLTTSILEPKFSYDEYGNSLFFHHATKTCYSFGENGIDDSRSGDDIYE